MIILRADTVSATEWVRAAESRREAAVCVADMASARLITAGLEPRRPRTYAEVIGQASIGHQLDRFSELIREVGPWLPTLRARLPLLHVHAASEGIADELQGIAEQPIRIVAETDSDAVADGTDKSDRSFLDPLLVNLILPTTPRWLDYAVGAVRAANIRRGRLGAAPLRLALPFGDPAAAVQIARRAAKEFLVAAPSAGDSRPGTLVVTGGTIFAEVARAVGRAIATGARVVAFDDGSLPAGIGVHFLARDETSFYEQLTEVLITLPESSIPNSVADRTDFTT